MNISFTELEQLKAHISDEIQTAFQKQIDPLLKRVDAVEGQVVAVEGLKKDVDDLKKNQGRALVGWTVLVAGVCLLFEQAKSWLAAKVFHTNG